MVLPETIRAALAKAQADGDHGLLLEARASLQASLESGQKGNDRAGLKTIVLCAETALKVRRPPAHVHAGAAPCCDRIRELHVHDGGWNGPALVDAWCCGSVRTCPSVGSALPERSQATVVLGFS